MASSHPKGPPALSGDLALVIDMLDASGRGVLVFDLDEAGREVLGASNASACRLLHATSEALRPGRLRDDIMPLLSGLGASSGVEAASRPRPGCGSILILSPAGRQPDEETGMSDLEAQYHAVLESTPSGVLRIRPDGSADYANAAALSLFDVALEDLDVARQLVPSDGRPLAWHITYSPRFEAEISLSYLTLHLIASVSKPLRIRGTAMRILGLTDITPLKEARSRIEFLARHDPLTGLGNRTQLKSVWDALEPRLGVGGQSLHVVALDLDHFKQVNDHHGHAIGDELLRLVAERLRSSVGPASHLFRFGGDEFLAILDGPSRGEAIETAERIVADLARPFHIGGHELQIGCSAGIASAPLDGLSREQIHRAADLALYEVKRHGRNGVACFDPVHEQAMLERRLLQTDLALAIANEDFHLVFQRQVEPDGERTLALEALLRWHNRRLGRLIPPAEFIPIAEQAGLVNLIDLWVIRHAVAELARFIEAGWDRPHLAINLSPLTLGREDIPALLAEALDRHAIPGDCLEIEITEGVVIAERHELGAIIGRLRAMGVKVAIDDFGAGQTSFGYLQSLPVQRLKLDQSIVRGIGAPDCSSPIIASIWDLCRRLGLKMTAEGIETAEEWAAIRAIGPIEGQGFFLGRPEDPAAILERLRAERRERAPQRRGGRS